MDEDSRILFQIGLPLVLYCTQFTEHTQEPLTIPISRVRSIGVAGGQRESNSKEVHKIEGQITSAPETNVGVTVVIAEQRDLTPDNVLEDMENPQSTVVFGVYGGGHYFRALENVVARDAGILERHPRLVKKTLIKRITLITPT